jgi:RimJ/RimL family protein N-acetyltransferase
MNISTSLFEGKLIRLGSLDHEKDPSVESTWTHDPSFMRMMYAEAMRPLSSFQIKKKYEALEKELVEDNGLFHFQIRTVIDDRLVGFGELHQISWPTRIGQVRLGIGSSDNRRKGYGGEALSLMLRYAFAEINLFRLTAIIAEYNHPAQAMFEKAGFHEEVRRRKALARDGRRWDAVHYGLLASEWEA